MHVVSLREFTRMIDEAATEVDLVVAGASISHDPLIASTAGKVLRVGDRPVLVVKRRPRTGYRRVLVPVDFSHLSRPALALARLVAPAAGVALLHVHDSEMDARLRQAGATDDKVRQYGIERVESASADLEALARDDTDVSRSSARHGAVTRLLAEGRPATIIAEVARRRRTDLVVIGTHGRTAVRHALLGRVAEHVVRDAACDVLVLRPTGFQRRDLE